MKRFEDWEDKVDWDMARVYVWIIIALIAMICSSCSKDRHVWRVQYDSCTYCWTTEIEQQQGLTRQCQSYMNIEMDCAADSFLIAHEFEARAYEYDVCWLQINSIELLNNGGL